MSSEGEQVPGLRAPVRKALTERMLLCGVPHKYVGMLLCSVGLLVFVFHLWWFLAVAALLYVLIAAAYAKDPYYLECWVQNRGADRFEP